MDIKPIQKQLKISLSKIPDKLSRILTFRYGLNNTKKLLPKKIAKELSLKEKEVIILEERAIRRLRLPKLAKPLIHMLDSLKTDIWGSVSEKINDTTSIIYRESHTKQFFKKLPEEINLLILLIYGTAEQWLSSFASKTDLAWFRSTYPEQEILNKLSKIKQADTFTTYPIPCGRFLTNFQIETEFIDLIFALYETKLCNYHGYITLKPLSTVDMRSIRIHLLLLYHYPDSRIPVSQIISTYNNFYSDDEISFEIIEPTLKSKQNLFKILEDKECSAIGSENDVKSYDEFSEKKHTDNADTHYIFNRPWSETLTNDLVKEIIEVKGMIKRKDLMDIFHKKTNCRFTMLNSNIPVVATVLSTNPNIMKPAPGVYCLKEKFKSSITNINTDLLLTYHDSKQYVLWRYAGEPINSFPLWSTTMEFNWCNWLEEKIQGIVNKEASLSSNQLIIHRRLFNSLLYVSDPNAWPLNDIEKKIWRFKKQSLGYYHYQKLLTDDIILQMPTLQELFMVTKLIKHLGYINSIRTNMIMLKTKLATSASIITLALLIILDIIRPNENWQKKHQIGPAIEKRLSLMIEEIKKKGFLHWEDNVGLFFKTEISKMVKQSEIGWVDGYLIEIIMKMINNKPYISPKQNNTKKEALNQSTFNDQSKKTVPVQLELF
jgi:hypothetical protein